MLGEIFVWRLDAQSKYELLRKFKREVIAPTAPVMGGNSMLGVTSSYSGGMGGFGLPSGGLGGGGLRRSNSFMQNQFSVGSNIRSTFYHILVTPCQLITFPVPIVAMQYQQTPLSIYVVDRHSLSTLFLSTYSLSYLTLTIITHSLISHSYHYTIIILCPTLTASTIDATYEYEQPTQCFLRLRYGDTSYRRYRRG